MSRLVPNPFEARSVNAGGWERHDFAPLRAVGDLAPQTPSPPPGGYPPGTNVLGIPGQPVTAEAIQWARRQIEKIRTAVGTGNLMFPAWLENYSDETSEIREHYHRMLTSESTIKAAVGTKVLSVMAQDIQVHPAEPTNARHKEAGDNFKQCLMGIGVGQRSVNAIGQQKIAWSVLIPAITNGWSVSEAVWKDAPEWRGKARGKLFYRDFKSKDPRRLTQLVDEFKNLVGLRTNLDAGRVFAGDLLQDMVFFSHWSLYESPLGISDMRAAYRAWWIKNVARRLQALGLDRFTGPFLVGKYQEGADDKRVALQQALSDARSEGWLTIPVDTMVEVVNLATGTNEVFTAAIESCDKEMLMGLLGSHLQLMEGQDGNRAGDTTEHAKQGDLFTWHLGSCLGGVITGQMAPSWYDRNYADIEPARVQWGGAKSVSEMVAQADLEKKLQELGYRQSRQQGMQFYNISEPMDANDVLTPPAPPGQQPPPGAPGLPGPGMPPNGPAGPGPAEPPAQVLAGLPDRQGGTSNVPVFNGTGDVYPHEQRPQISQMGEDVRFFAEAIEPEYPYPRGMPRNFAEERPPSQGESLASWYAGLLNDLLATQTNVDDLIQGADEELEGTGWGLDQDDDTGLWEPREEGYEQGALRTFAEGDWVPYLGKRGARAGQQVGWTNGTRVVYGDKKPGSRQRRTPDAPSEPINNRATGRSRQHLEQRLAPHAQDFTPAQQANAKRSLAQLRRHHGDEGVIERIHQITDNVEKSLDKVESSRLPPEQKQALRDRLHSRLAQLHSAANAHSAPPGLDTSNAMNMANLDEPDTDGITPRGAADVEDLEARAARGRNAHRQNAYNRYRRDEGNPPVGHDRHYGARVQAPTAADAPAKTEPPKTATAAATPTPAPPLAAPEKPLPPETRDQTINRTEASRRLGKEVSRRDVANLTGGAHSQGTGPYERSGVDVFGSGEVQFRGSSAGKDGKDHFNTTVTLRKVGDQVHGHYDYIAADRSNPTLGPRILADQLKSLRSLGVSHIDCLAARVDGSHGLIGYKLWPKLGMDGPIPSDKKTNWPEEFKQAKTMQELYSKPGGRQFWEEHGFSIPLGIDLSDPQKADKMTRLANFMARSSVRQHSEGGNEDQPSEAEIEAMRNELNNAYPPTPEEWEKYKAEFAKEQAAKS